MAAALHAKILSEGYTPGMLRAAGAATTDTANILHQHFNKLTTLQRLRAPRPQRQHEDYAHILGWEEREKEQAVVTPPASGHRRLQPPHQIYIESVLAQHHARLRRHEFNLAWTKASRRTNSNEVNAWPPIPNPVASPHEMKPEVEFDAARRPDTLSRNYPAAQRTESSRYADMPSIGDIEDSGGRPQGSPTSFIDSDGLEWPLPPRECLFSPVADAVPACTLAEPPSTLTPALFSNTELPTVSPLSFVESDESDGPLLPRECVASPDPTMSPRGGAQAPANSDRSSDRTPPLICDTSRTSLASNSTSPTLPLTPIGWDDECYRPRAVPAGVGIIGEGRPPMKPTTESKLCGESWREPESEEVCREGWRCGAAPRAGFVNALEIAISMQTDDPGVHGRPKGERSVLSVE